MSWRHFVMDLEALDPERVEDVFTEHGALAVTLSDAGDDPVLEPGPGETPLWGDTRVTGLFALDSDLEPLKDALCRTFGLHRLPRWHTEVLADRDWEREWLRDFRPMRFGQRFWVIPRDASAPRRKDAVVMRLDPGLAFGTGTHATTALCLEWLDGLPLAGQRILDYGCGSGILAICALLAGAAAAVAVDIDPQAITATRDNARCNAVESRLHAGQPDEGFGGDFDIVVANILAGPLIEVAPTLLGLLRPGGRFALSGILESQADDVAAAYAAATSLARPVVRDGWVRIAGVKR